MSQSKNQKIIDGAIVLSEFNDAQLPIPESGKMFLYAEYDNETLNIKIKTSTNGEKTLVTQDQITGLSPGGVLSDPSGITGASSISNIVQISQANYDLIVSPDRNACNS